MSITEHEAQFGRSSRLLASLWDRQDSVAPLATRSPRRRVSAPVDALVRITDSETGDPVCVSAPGPRAAVRGEQGRSYASASGVNGEAVAPGRRSGAAMNRNS